jgi:hypothetical protein
MWTTVHPKVGPESVMHASPILGPLLALAAASCAARVPPAEPPPAAPVVIHDTVTVERVVTVTRMDTVADPSLRTRVAQLELDVLAGEARIQTLEEQLEEARREVVRTMARSQTVASRAEAASGIAEAELAIRTLRTEAGRRNAPEATQADRLLEQSNEEFKKANFGGALYLAGKARTIAGQGTDRFRRVEAAGLRPGETPFETQLPLRTTTRANVREGPSTGTRILFMLEPGSAVVAVSQVEGWVKVNDEAGRSGWIARALVERRE